MFFETVLNARKEAPRPPQRPSPMAGMAPPPPSAPGWGGAPQSLMRADMRGGGMDCDYCDSSD